MTDYEEEAMKKTKKDKVVWEVRIHFHSNPHKYYWEAKPINNSTAGILSLAHIAYGIPDGAKSDFLSFARRALKPGSWKIIEG